MISGLQLMVIEVHSGGSSKLLVPCYVGDLVFCAAVTCWKPAARFS
jgi:hypothetical protein